MSSVNRGQEVSLSDSYVLLLQDTIKETRGLRAQVAERAEKEDEVNRRLEQLVNKVDELCEKVNNADSSRKRKRSTSHSKVPSKCRVRCCFILLVSWPSDRSKKDFATYKRKCSRLNHRRPKLLSLKSWWIDGLCGLQAAVENLGNKILSIPSLKLVPLVYSCAFWVISSFWAFCENHCYVVPFIRLAG